MPDVIQSCSQPHMPTVKMILTLIIISLGIGVLALDLPEPMKPPVDMTSADWRAECYGYARQGPPVSCKDIYAYKYEHYDRIALRNAGFQLGGAFLLVMWLWRFIVMVCQGITGKLLSFARRINRRVAILSLPLLFVGWGRFGMMFAGALFALGTVAFTLLAIDRVV